MADVIILDANLRTAVRGKSDRDEFAALEPVRLLDGRFFVGTEVLADRAFMSTKFDGMKVLAVVTYESIRALVPPPPPITPARGSTVKAAR